MSAWTVEFGHIDVLVVALYRYGIVADRDTQDTGQMLWAENYRSVNYRYGEDDRTPEYLSPIIGGGAVVDFPDLHPVAVLKAAGCYAYQSCEHPGWERSQAKRLCDELGARILAAHPELASPVPCRYRAYEKSPAYYAHPVYDAAPWGFTALAEAYATAYQGGGAR